VGVVELTTTTTKLHINEDETHCPEHISAKVFTLSVKQVSQLA